MYWSLDEITRAINEGLLYWGALTSYWRERGSFNTVVNTPYYDLNAQIPTLRARTYTLGQLVREIQYHLNELSNGVSGAGMTTQFTINQIVSALIRSRNQLVLNTKLPLTISSQLPISPPPSGRVSLDESVVLIGHAEFTDGDSNITYPLRREDAWSEDSANPVWTLEPGTPYAYSTAETRPIELQLYPAPLSSGTLRLIYVQSIQLASLESTTLLIPDEFVSAVKWGALYSILSTQNEGFDPLRAKYSKARYDQLVQVSSLMRSVIRVQLNDISLPLDSLLNLDAARPFWRNRLGRPDLSAAMFDIVCLAKSPDSIYGVTCDVVRSAPLPTASGDFIQLGSEDIPYLIDYVRHILSFKLGGSEFTDTMPLYDNFLSAASERNKLLSNKAKYLTPLFGVSKIQEEVQPIA